MNKTPNYDPSWKVPKAEYNVFRNKNSKYCLVIPVINEGEKIKKELGRIKEHNIHKLVDIIIVDGGSTDGSLEESFLKDHDVRALITKKDTGKLSAQLRIGYAYALSENYDGVVTIDGNNKDSVESVTDFVKAMEEGYDMVQGSRFIKGGKAINTPMIRELAVKFIHIPLINLAAGFRYTDTTNGFRGYSKNYLMHEKVKPFRDVFNTYELLAYLSARAPRLKLKVKEVPVTRTYPPKGKTPTKIKFFRGNSDLMKILFKLLLGKYNP